MAPGGQSNPSKNQLYPFPIILGDRPQILSYNMRDLFKEKRPANLLRFRRCIANAATKYEDALVRRRARMENSTRAIDWGAV